MVHLLDVNTLIALCWPSHIHHEPAHSWFADNCRFGWATCPITQLGFVRVSSNSNILPDSVSPRESAEVLGKMISHENHVFWQDIIPFFKHHIVSREYLVEHRQVTEAYLLSLAVRNNGGLATFDKGVYSLLAEPDPRRNVITIIGGE
jgi:toxin-antitoxin system PIN domain toxin